MSIITIQITIILLIIGVQVIKETFDNDFLSGVLMVIQFVLSICAWYVSDGLVHF